jgi:hypothetical protein
MFYRVSGEVDNSVLSPVAPIGEHYERYLRLNAAVQARQGNVDLIFIGDSITQHWETTGRMVWNKYYGDRNALNLGIAGDRIQHVLWRLDNGSLCFRCKYIYGLGSYSITAGYA